MTQSEYNDLYIWFDSNERGYSYFSYYHSNSAQNGLKKKTSFQYKNNVDTVTIYENDRSFGRTLEKRHLQEFIDFCKNKGIEINEIKEAKVNKGKFTVEKLLEKMGIEHMSCQYSCSQTIKFHKDREIVAYVLGPYSGLIIAKKLNENEGYFASRFFITRLKRGQATFVGMDMNEAISELRKFKKEGYKVVLSKKTEEKLQSAIFMKNI